ncbi:RNA-binding domain-containing protein [Eremomyces bilateralis CBS 781.70]|uniref:RNA-binding domain-containing protein n=1 Tax=Eremomyces bilateralis CBS 781.70 TaxID=1392243 RepID=A0A6G1GFL6_9PEZI|nr:RNA-binding domain-containing protein [Eremomyces bilateralis CBS 781.70]KAF1816711.1 RNA-binding domain-containing protein [Eremomyces bilateralis CBS 781.70]
MALPPPPGVSRPPTSTTPQPHPSLPARPPPPSDPLPPLRSGGALAAGQNKSRNTNFSTFTGFKPRSVASASSASQQQWPSYTATASPAPTTGYAAPPVTQTTSYQSPAYAQQSSYYPQQAVNYGGSAAPYTAAYPPPAQAGTFTQAPLSHSAAPAYETDYDAQVAQWQSAYAPRDDGKKLGNANNIPLGARGGTDAGASATPIGVAVPADPNQKTVVRSGGGKTWEDTSLLEWDPSHFRLFVGNLAGEVTDDSLLKAFVRYPSLQKGRVVRDKKSTKSKGYGFVSFSDADDYFKAAKEMQGKYIGSHPIQIQRCKTDIKPMAMGQRGRGGRHSGRAGGRDRDQNKVAGHAQTGAGVQKKPAKTKGGLKILG